MRIILLYIILLILSNSSYGQELNSTIQFAFDSDESYLYIPSRNSIIKIYLRDSNNPDTLFKNICFRGDNIEFVDFAENYNNIENSRKTSLLEYFRTIPGNVVDKCLIYYDDGIMNIIIDINEEITIWDNGISNNKTSTQLLEYIKRKYPGSIIYSINSDKIQSMNPNKEVYLSKIETISVGLFTEPDTYSEEPHNDIANSMWDKYSTDKLDIDVKIKSKEYLENEELNKKEWDQISLYLKEFINNNSKVTLDDKRDTKTRIDRLKLVMKNCSEYPGYEPSPNGTKNIILYNDSELALFFNHSVLFNGTINKQKLCELVAGYGVNCVDAEILDFIFNTIEKKEENSFFENHFNRNNPISKYNILIEASNN